MVSEKMATALNRQINAEIYSGYLYLSMATWFDFDGLHGFAHWMKEQAKEEYDHALRIYDYLVESGVRVQMAAIEAPQTDWGNPQLAFEFVLEHEKKVTAMIHALMEQAKQEGDEHTQTVLGWFVNEQKEEEATAGVIAQKVKRASEADSIDALDEELGKREYEK